MDAGFIKLHRKIMKWEWYTDANTVRLFFHLLLSANYKASRYQGHEVPAGSLVCGRKELAAELGISERNVRTALKHLKSTSEATIKSTSKFSIISMTNWSNYQDNDQQSDQQVTSSRPASDQQVTTSKEGKKERKKEVIGARAKTPGTRIPDDWQPDEVFAQREGIGQDRTRREADKFRDYWKSQPGQKGVKTDWDATWRNWVRKAAEAKPAPCAKPPADRYASVPSRYAI